MLNRDIPYHSKLTKLSLILGSLLSGAVYANNMMIGDGQYTQQITSGSTLINNILLTGRNNEINVNLEESATWLGGAVLQASTDNYCNNFSVNMAPKAEWHGGVSSNYIGSDIRILMDKSLWYGDLNSTIEYLSSEIEVEIRNNSRWEGDISTIYNGTDSDKYSGEQRVTHNLNISNSIWKGNANIELGDFSLSMNGAKWAGDIQLLGFGPKYISIVLADSSLWQGNMNISHPDLGGEDIIHVRNEVANNSIWQGDFILESKSKLDISGYSGIDIHDNSLWKGNTRINVIDTGVYLTFYIGGNSIWSGDLYEKSISQNSEYNSQHIFISDYSQWVGGITQELEAQHAFTNISMSNNSQWDGNLDVMIKTKEQSWNYIYLSDNSHWYGDATFNSAVAPSTDRLADSLQVELNHNSSWTGKLSSKNAESTVALSSNSRWNITGDSYVTHLRSSNDQPSDVNTVNFTSLDNTNKRFYTLTTNDLQGDFDFRLRAEVVNAEIHSDKIVLAYDPQYSNDVSEQASNHRLFIKNNGASGIINPQQVTVVENQTSQKHNFSLNNALELGGYLYKLTQMDNNWVLEQIKQGVADTATAAGVLENNATTQDMIASRSAAAPRLTSTADASANVSNTNYLLTYAEMQSLMQRMGDLHQDKGAGNLWLRGVTGRLSSFDNGLLQGTTMNYHGFQLGADKQLNYDDGSRVYFGALVGLTNSSQDYRHGDGSIKSHSGGVYASYIFPDSTYVDTVVKYNRLKNKFNVLDTAGMSVQGNSSSSGFSASLAGGHRFHLADNDAGFYLEPQVQLTVSRQQADAFTASNGLHTKLEGYTSTLGQAGTLIGYEVTKGQAPVNIYLQTAYVREFSADPDYALNGNKHNQSFKGNWWRNGVGISTQINQKHTFHLDAGLTTGSRFNQEQANVGYRYSF